MIYRTADSNSFELVAIASLRAHQLRRGCTPRVAGDHKATMLARMEVAAGKVERLAAERPADQLPQDVLPPKA
jgi:DNA-directed RNA polymerase subunit K/omega